MSTMAVQKCTEDLLQNQTSKCFSEKWLSNLASVYAWTPIHLPKTDAYLDILDFWSSVLYLMAMISMSMIILQKAKGQPVLCEDALR
jgi:hypothetical protein